MLAWKEFRGDWKAAIKAEGGGLHSNPQEEGVKISAPSETKHKETSMPWRSPHAAVSYSGSGFGNNLNDCSNLG